MIKLTYVTLLILCTIYAVWLVIIYAKLIGFLLSDYIQCTGIEDNDKDC